MLKENLSPDVLNVFRTESNPSPLKPRGRNMDPSHGLGSPIPATTIGVGNMTIIDVRLENLKPFKMANV